MDLLADSKPPLRALFRARRDSRFAMGPATRIEMLTDHFTVRDGQRHAIVCGETKKYCTYFGVCPCSVRVLSVFCPCPVHRPPKKNGFFFRQGDRFRRLVTEDKQGGEKDAFGTRARIRSAPMPFARQNGHAGFANPGTPC